MCDFCGCADYQTVASARAAFCLLRFLVRSRYVRAPVGVSMQPDRENYEEFVGNVRDHQNAIGDDE